ncbi:MAG TPA: hypothetical protein DCM14_06900 [Clostridiales bacterium UBA8153]|nr:hypothetical protein [Clostridiales bacterium UBA8153]
METALREQAMPDTDVLGVGFPVYAFGPPRLVDRFLQTLPAGAGRPAVVWAVAAGIVGGATAAVAGRLEAAGYRVVHEQSYLVPENWHWRRSDPDAAALAQERAWRRTGELVSRAAHELVAGQLRRTRPGPIRLRLMSGWAWRWHLSGAERADRYLRVTGACNACGLCARACPTSALAGHPSGYRVGPDCTLCLRCASICPAQAITAPLMRQGWLHRHLEPGYRQYLLASTTRPQPGEPAQDGSGTGGT